MTNLMKLRGKQHELKYVKKNESKFHKKICELIPKGQLCIEQTNENLGRFL